MNLLIEAYLDLFSLALGNGMRLTPELNMAIEAIGEHFERHGWIVEICGSENTFYYFHFVKHESKIDKKFIVQLENGHPLILEYGDEGNDKF